MTDNQEPVSLGMGEGLGRPELPSPTPKSAGHEAQHSGGGWTPKPWRISSLGDVVGDEDRDGYVKVALCPCPSSPRKAARWRQWQIDARLIAAAPEMAAYIEGRASQGDKDAARIMEIIRGR